MTLSRPAALPSQFFRLILFVSLSLVAMTLDHRFHYLADVRSALSVALTPLQMIATVPAKVGEWWESTFQSEDEVRDELKTLQRRHILLQVRQQRLKALEAENKNLRRLLSAKERVAGNLLIAELVEVSLDPFTHKILINRGLTDDVYLGQPVLDPNGIMGQVTQVMPFVSTVILLTDPSHAIPVQVRRNGLRAIVFGTGVKNQLRIPHLPRNADIQDGDVLITSGMGGRFPPGYPVAQVARVSQDANEAFLKVAAAPVARLDHTREVLLLWPGEEADD